MPSPATTAFAKYVDIPVSYHTGVPNISLPIGSVTDGSLQLPISLSYHASGIRMAETASWVGLGWNISGVGQVTRTVNGYPDEKDRGYLKDHLNGISRGLGMLLPGTYGIEAWGTIGTGEGIDYEPDMFSFSAGSYSGKFYIHPTEGVILLPKQDIKILHDYAGDDNIDYFTIITPVGDRYHFGKVSTNGSYSVEGQYEYADLPNNFSPVLGVKTRQTWYLVKIEDTNLTNSINVSYEKEWAVSDNRSPNYEYKVGTGGSSQYPLVVLTNVNYSLRLKKITNSTETEEIVFNANTLREDLIQGTDVTLRVKRLDEILVRLGTNDDYVKKMVFTYDYLLDNSCTLPHCKRLRLTQFQEVSGDNSIVIPPHIFEYQGDNTYPNRYSKAIDHWGFYNGATSNNNIDISIPSQGANREPNETHTKKGILKKITYPTGGNAEFLFEQNTYLKYSVVAPQYCGGLRIKKISASDGTQVKETNYDYSGEGTDVSSGLLITQPKYELTWSVTNGNIGGEARIVIKTETTTTPLNDYNGYHVYYNKVSELRQGIGKTIYRFETERWSNYNNNCIFGNSYPFRGSPIYMGSDKIKSQTNVANNNTIASTVIYDNQLPFIGTTANELPAYKVSNIVSSSTTMAHFVVSLDLPKSFEYGRLRSKTEVSDNVETKTEFTYSTTNLHNNPIEIKTTNSTGKIHKTKIFYPLDNLSNAISSEFIARYITAVPLYSKNYVDNTPIGGSEIFIGGSQVIYGASDYGHFLPMSANSFTKDQQLKLERLIETYNENDLPLVQRTNDYMLATYYQWDIKKRLTSQTLGRTWATNRLKDSIEYIGNTPLVNRTIDVNGLIKKYSYDKLARLNIVNDRMKPDGTDIQATVTYSYHYKNGATDNNYMGTISSFKGVSTSLSAKQYSDGLGRPISLVKENYTPSGLNQINNVTYDVLGRQSRTYLPFESNTLQSSAGYIETIYEASPLSRPISQRNPDGTFTYMSYGTNIAADAVQIFTPSIVSGTVASAVSSSIYAANTLYKTTMTDENGKQTCVFKDKLGRVILTRRFLNGASGTNVDTYNVYDDYGQLVVVVPPGALTISGTAATVMNDLTFQYKYDNKNRLIEKKVPGSDSQNFYYDVRDFLVMTQDGNMREAKNTSNVLEPKYFATLYDDIGRVIKTGFTTTTPTLTDGNCTTNIATAITDKLTETIYYPNRAWVKHQGAKVLKPSTVGTLNSEFLWSYTERRVGIEYTGNPVWQGKQHLRYNSVSKNPILDSDTYGVDWVVSGYNGMQQPDLTIRYLFEGGAGEVRTWQNFTYDNARRLTDVKYNYGTGGAGISSPTYGPSLSNMVYNFKDQLIEKNISLTGTSALQSIDYTYNIRGWLTNINNVALFTNGTTSIMTPPMSGSSPIQNLAITPYINKAVQEAVQPYRAANANELPPLLNDGVNVDLFSQNITYGNPASQTGAASQNNGNISSTTWQVLGRAKQAYGFTYDGLDRLTEAKYFDITEGYVNGQLNSQYSTDNKFKEAIQYDLRGNILGLQRNGFKNGAWTVNNYTAGEYGQIDQLTYYYNAKNQVLNITDGAVNFNGPNAGKDYKGFVYNPSASLLDNNVTGGNHYAYDKNGNLLADLHKDITLIEYNYLNLPQVITFTGGRSIQFVYDATGVKLKKITNDNGTIVRYDYINGVEYKNDVLQRFAHTEGSVALQSNGVYIHEYVLRDHLGNTRVTFTDADNNGLVNANDIKQINHYYPFGLNMEGNWQGGAQGDNKYQYNGKQWNDDFGLGWNDYGARFYDPAIARWGAVDLLSDKYRAYSPYNYCVNKPTIYIDPSGMNVEAVTVNGYSGYQYTGADVQRIYNFLTSTSKNYYLAMVPDGKQSYNNFIPNPVVSAKGSTGTIKGDWTVYAGSSLDELSNLMSVVPAQSVDNLALMTHGTQVANGPTLPITDPNYDNGKGERILQDNEKLWSPNKELYTSNMTTNTGASKFLSSIMDKVKANGNFIFLGCNLGKGDAGNDFLKAARDLGGSRFNVYAAQDWIGERGPKDFSAVELGGNYQAPSVVGGRVSTWKGYGALGEKNQVTFMNYTSILISVNSSNPVQFIK